MQYMTFYLQQKALDEPEGCVQFPFPITSKRPKDPPYASIFQICFLSQTGLYFDIFTQIVVKLFQE